MRNPARRAAILGCLAAISIACVVGTASAAASEVETVQVPARIEAAPIASPDGLNVYKGEEPAKGRTFTFSVDTSSCPGSEPTVFHEVKVVERPSSNTRLREGHGKATIITVFVEHPAYLKPIETVGTDYQVACPEMSITKRIKLKRPVGRLAFFDGSFSPPRPIWPVIEYGIAP